MYAQGLPPEWAGFLISRMTFAALLDGDVLYRRGDPAESAYLLLTGQACVAEGRFQWRGAMRGMTTICRMHGCDVQRSGVKMAVVNAQQ